MGSSQMLEMSLQNVKSDMVDRKKLPYLAQRYNAKLLPSSQNILGSIMLHLQTLTHVRCHR